MKVIYCYFCHVLLVIETHTVTVWKGKIQECEDQGVRMIGGHLESWLPPWLWVFTSCFSEDRRELVADSRKLLYDFHNLLNHI